MPETSAIRAKTRRVKDIILDQFLGLADKKTPLSESEKKLYEDLMLTFARNVVPRTTELTGEEGEAINVSVTKYGDTTTTPIPATELPAAITESI